MVVPSGKIKIGGIFLPSLIDFPRAAMAFLTASFCYLSSLWTNMHWIPIAEDPNRGRYAISSLERKLGASEILDIAIESTEQTWLHVSMGATSFFFSTAYFSAGYVGSKSLIFFFMNLIWINPQANKIILATVF